MSENRVLAARVFPRLYRDSVALMAIASATEKLDGIDRVGAVMATPANLEILSTSAMLPDGVTASPDDLVFVVRGADPETVQAALDAAESGLTAQESGRRHAERLPGTLDEGIAAAVAADPERPPTLATISIPGVYAPVAVERAIRRGLHVLCFSDNVSVEDELRLKMLAVERGVLLMGPDCGTAILDGSPLGFANVVRAGSIGIVAASGTGAQEVSRLIDDAGAGVSQLIGVGGRDLSAHVGGVMTSFAIDHLVADEATTLLMVVSKPPAPEVAASLLAKLEQVVAGGMPVVACFLGAEDRDPADPSSGVFLRGTLEGGALVATALAGSPLAVGEPTVAVQAPKGRILGLYTGGTLASEAKIILKRAGIEAEIIDLGDDEYTAGRPHPMIDPDARAQVLADAGADPTVGVILVDLVLGYGSHHDPATALATAVAAARGAAARDGRQLLVIGSVCGTRADPQGIQRQRDILLGEGIVLTETNAAAARLAADCVAIEDRPTNEDAA